MTHPAPAAVDALLALLRADPALDYVVNDRPARVRVDDGPPTRDMDDPDAIGIGMAIQDVNAAQGTTTHRVGPREELFDLTCAIDSWTGDADGLPARRARAYDLLEVVLALIERNRTLNGAVMAARLARHTYRPYQDADGAGVLLEFALTVKAYRPRR